MVTVSAARKILLALPDTEEKAHLGHPDFRVNNRIFASLAPTKNKKKVVVVKLSPANQTAVMQIDPDAYSVNGWSRQGWTTVHLDKVTPSRFRSLAQSSWAEVAAKKKGIVTGHSLARHFVTEACNNAWANHRLLKACLQLTDEEFVAPRTSFFPSLKATLNHILTVDWYYLEMLERSHAGLPPHPQPHRHFEPEEPFERCADVAREQHTADRRLIAFCESLDDTKLDVTILLPRKTGLLRDYTRRILAHLFEHQIHHRGQAHAMLAGTRIAPPQLDEFFCTGEAHLRAQDFAELGFSETAIWGERAKPPGRMTRHVAFLRAINVGGHGVVKMSDLARRLTALGLSDVTTFIASGNVIFEAEGKPLEIAQRIEADLLEWLGYPVATMVRTWDELEALATSNPFKGVTRQPDAKLYVAFLWELPMKKPKLPRVSEGSGLRLFRIAGREAFMVAERLPNGKFGVPNLPLEKELGVPATTRNWNTILRLINLKSPS